MGKKDLTSTLSSTAPREFEKDLVHLEAKGAGTVKQAEGIVASLPLLQTRPSEQIAPPAAHVQRAAVVPAIKAELGVVVPSRSLPMNQRRSSSIAPEAPSASQRGNTIDLANDGVSETHRGTNTIAGSGKFASMSLTSDTPAKKATVSTWAKVEKPLSIMSGQDSRSRQSGRIQAAEIGDLMLSTVGLVCFMVAKRISGRMRKEIGQEG
jgi:hypothetical protein